MRASYIVFIAVMLMIPSVGYSQQSGPDGGPVGGKVGADLSAPSTQGAAPATRGPYGRPDPLGRPAGYTGPVTPGQVVPGNVQITPRPGGVGSAYVNGRLVLVDPSNRVLRVLH
jgi:hypothetical protein